MDGWAGSFPATGAAWSTWLYRDVFGRFTIDAVAATAQARPVPNVGDRRLEAA